MSYQEYYINRNQEHLEENKKFPIKVWKSIMDGNPYEKDNSSGLSFYVSIFKKIEKFSKQYNLTKKQLCENLLSLQGICLDQVLNLWAVKPERQNLNELWKKEYIENNSSFSVEILPKSGPESLMLTESFEIKNKVSKNSLSENDSEMKTFDFIIKGMRVITKENGLLVVDKTTKVTGGSQKDTQRDMSRTILHLSKDPKKRHYCVLLDGEFWEKFRNEMKDKYENVLILTTDELILM